MTVRRARAVRPPRPMTLPRSSGCTRTSMTLPRRRARLRTRTSSGYWTMPRTRCSRASSSTSGLSPCVSGDLGGRLGGGLFGRGGGLLGRRRLGRGRRSRARLGRRRLGRRCLGLGRRGGGLLGRGGLGLTARRGLGPRAALGRGLLVLFLAGLAGLCGSVEGFLLVPARRGGAEGAFAPRLSGELLPVPGDLEQDADRVRGLGAHRQPVLDPFGVHFDEGGLGLRVVLADLLDGAPVALGA